MMIAFLLCLSYGGHLVQAICDSGFLVANPHNNTESWVFTEVLESDFTHTDSVSNDKDWTRQQFNVSAEAGRGKYAKEFMPGNVVPQPVPPHQQGNTSGGEDAGLVLRVSTVLQREAVVSAEIDTTRKDLMYGSFRAGMKLPNVSGTCAAFFWYNNNTQEIDIEFLSREYDENKGIYPINLVIQSKQSMEAGYDAAATGTFKHINLPFDPTSGFHEYRFDYLAKHVYFYADSILIAEMEGEAVPSSAGHLILQHWSNGNPLWSGGPPENDAVLIVSYVKAYFNNTNSDCVNLGAYETKYNSTSDDKGVCVVPNVIASNASTGGDYFSHESSTYSGDPNTESNATRCNHYPFWVLCLLAIGVYVVYEEAERGGPEP